MRHPIPVVFPMGGINENAAYAGEPGAIVARSDHVLNCRPFDSLERRQRGGKRTGISKQFSTAINGATAIQRMAMQVKAVDIIQQIGWGDAFTDSGTRVSNAEDLQFSPNGDAILAVTSNGTTNYIGGFPFDTQTGFSSEYSAAATNPSNPDLIRSFSWHPDGTYFVALTRNTSNDDVKTWIYPFDSSTGFGAVDTDTLFDSNVNSVHVAWHPSGDYIAVTDEENDFIRVYAWTSGGGINTTAVFSTATGVTGSTTGLSWNSDGTALALLAGSETNDLRVFPFSTSTGFGTAITQNTSMGTTNVVKFANNSGYVAVGGTTTPYAKIYSFDGASLSVLSNPGTLPGTDVLDIAWSYDDGAIVLALDATPDAALYAFDGAWGDRASNPSPIVAGNSDGVAMHPSEPVVVVGSTTTPDLQSWYFSPSTVNPSARETRLVVVSGGTVKRSNPTFDAIATVNNGTGALRTSGFVMADAAFQRMFFVDGVAANYTFLDYADNTMKDWASNLSAGSLPAGTTDTTLGCEIFAVWRGRGVLARLREEPHNWFMSVSGDLFDFDYSPATTSATMAVAGNNSDAGELGDVLTALIPYNDDLLFMGGANTLWVMRGDPAAGGQIDNVSREIGIVGPDAWCIDPSGNLWFIGQNGLYRMGPGNNTPQLVSEGRLDKTLESIDFNAFSGHLVYDRRWHGVHIFFRPASQPAAPVDSYWYDIRTNSFWRDQIPVGQGPTQVLLFKPDDPEGRSILLGGWDGLIRKYDESVHSDDGTAIDAYWRFPILHPALPMGQFQLSEFQFHTDQDSDDVTLEIFRGTTPEEAALASSAAYSATLVGGRNLPHRKQLRANAFSMRIRNATLAETFAYENGVVMIEGVGRQRQRL